jgi:hypothetical protein|tara:strand:+ start:150 stop:389 length:240 start_codon:yes stop_codon:yes gene_type:complete
MSDNVINFPYKIKKTEKPIKAVCEMVANSFEDVVIIGVTKDKHIQMVTTMEDSADVLWNLENARFAIMQGLEEEGEYDE